MDTPHRPPSPGRPSQPPPPRRGKAPAPRSPVGPDPDAWVQAQPQPLPQPAPMPRPVGPSPFEPPTSVLAPMFLRRLDRIHVCRVPFTVDINTRPTTHVLGGYYRSRRLVRLYTHDCKDGRRPLNELFETFLHEVAHHLEYTEPQTFHSNVCRRVPGRMHSDLFWRILGELKFRWAEVVARHRAESQAGAGRS